MLAPSRCYQNTGRTSTSRDGDVMAMASREGPMRLGCGRKIPIEDSHVCVFCLGEDHTQAAREEPAACMSCFCMTARQREARYRLFKTGTPTLQ